MDSKIDMQSEMKEELKLCPFCGGEAEILPYSGQSVLLNHHNDCVVDMAKFYLNADDAIKAWNARADSRKERVR